MSLRQQKFSAQIVGIRRTHFPLRRVALALAAHLVILGVTGDLARAEDPPSGKVLSACRVPPREAYGEIRKTIARKQERLHLSSWPQPASSSRAITTMPSNKLIRPSNSIRQTRVSTASEAPPAGPTTSSAEAVEDLDHAISLDPGSSVAFLERGVALRGHERIRPCHRRLRRSHQALSRQSPRLPAPRFCLRRHTRVRPGNRGFRPVDQIRSPLPGRLQYQEASPTI